MPQSTLGGNLAGADYERAYRVLARCNSANCLTDFKEQVVASLGTVMGFRHVSFFAGPTFSSVFADRQPVTTGKTSRMLPEYAERWSHHDVFGTPQAMRVLQKSRVAATTELARTGAVNHDGTLYVRQFLTNTWGLGAAAAIQLDLYGHHTALIGVFAADEHDLGPQELATLRLIVQPLSGMARGVPFAARVHDCSALTPRQREVAHLVAEGFSNAKIAQTLQVTEESVKKYVTRILAAQGCDSRMELALLMRQGPCSRA